MVLRSIQLTGLGDVARKPKGKKTRNVSSRMGGKLASRVPPVLVFDLGPSGRPLPDFLPNGVAMQLAVGQYSLNF